jgi:hypothetical protein
MERDVMLGSLKLNLFATRRGVTVSYYDQDIRHHSGLRKVRIGTLRAEELQSGNGNVSLDITPLLPIARELFLKAGGDLAVDAA